MSSDDTGKQTSMPHGDSTGQRGVGQWGFVDQSSLSGVKIDWMTIIPFGS